MTKFSWKSMKTLWYVEFLPWNQMHDGAPLQTAALPSSHLAALLVRNCVANGQDVIHIFVITARLDGTQTKLATQLVHNAPKIMNEAPH